MSWIHGSVQGDPRADPEADGRRIRGRDPGPSRGRAFTPPGFEEWLTARDFFVAELWAMPVLHGFRAVFYVLGAVRLGRGGRTGREGALVCVVVEACAIVAGAAMGAVLLGLPSVVDVLAWSVVTALNLLWPGLLLLLLSVRSSREWFRSTGA